MNTYFEMSPGDFNRSRDLSKDLLTRDNLSSARAFVKRFAISYPTLTDDAILVKFRGQLSPNAIPTTLVLDKQNRIAARISGEITVLALENIIKKLLAE